MVVGAFLRRCGCSLWSVGRGTLILKSSLGNDYWTSIGRWCGLVSAMVAVECWSGHTHFKLKSWVCTLDFDWALVRSCVGVGRSGVYVGARSLKAQVLGVCLGLRLRVGTISGKTLMYLVNFPLSVSLIGSLFVICVYIYIYIYI